jgi:large subunit ribosomal protein L24
MKHIRKGDEVLVVCGKDAGKRGKVLFVDSKKQRVKVEKLNLIKRHVRPSQKHPQGGIVEKEGTIHISNVRLWDPKIQGPCRTGVRFIERAGSSGRKRKIRVSRKSGEAFDE